MSYYAPPPAPYPPSQETIPGRRGLVGFLTSLPGILTASAGLVTAVTGGVGLYFSQDDQPSVESGGTTYNIAVEGGAIPYGGGEVDTASLGTTLSDTSMDGEVSALVDGCLNGHPGSCETLLYLLAEECRQGYGISCDVLYYISEVGSDYETYGATCGGRYAWHYAVGACSEL
jgi:hypothetical protein